MIGQLNGGISGFSLGHSDIGGYTSLKTPWESYYRDKETLLRWIEINTFSDIIMRTHPSNNPILNW
jgi:alpha-glucosidase